MKNNKKIIMIICGLFILVSGFAYINSDAIGKFVYKDDTEYSSSDDTKYVSSKNTGCISSSDRKSYNKMSGKDNLNDKKSDRQSQVVVYICGAVKHPGVYKFTAGSRVNDAVNAASGFKKGAARTAINQARVLEDGEQITIPTLKQVKRKQLSKITDGDNFQDKTTDNENTDSSERESQDTLININTASAGELTSLSGIGQNRADAIIEYRQSNGKFQSIEDIMKIPGIKQGIFNKIKNKISV
ncbi:MAG: helix-hairpin-helix domain-containing protein [Butyribacter sp.]|uniref:helix-hairpin-helix domain-containing protein n=1 Tax=Butyribacter TaxID=2822463 RepID=UPI00383CF558|nr:helix-hairpin-helix domain-containing protein [Clostridium sp.]MCQ5165263.1 helix-hairpin-helix domain-containing protein [Roseburia hominis]